jgi:hypothetical protein
MAKVSTELAEKPTSVPKILCPNPSLVSLSESNVYFETNEFSTQQLSTSHHGNFGSNQANAFFMHTFNWKPELKCCQVLKAELILKVKALRPGSNPTTSPDAGNDTVTIVKNGGTTIISEKIYPSGSPFSAGYSISKTVVLNTVAQLSWLNTAQKLSFIVQDDTSVESATLKLTICCLSKPV